MHNDPSRLLSPGETERFKFLVDTISEYAIFALDDEGRITSWNRGATLLSGLSATDAIGQHLDSLFKGSSHSLGLMTCIQQAIGEAGRFESTEFLVRGTSSPVAVHVTAEALVGQNERDAAYGVTIRAIDEFDSADVHPLGTEDGFRTLVMNVSDYAISMLSLEGRVESWNKGAERINGYTAEEIIGTHFSAFFPSEAQAAGLPQRALEIAATKGHFHDEAQRVRKDGTVFWASIAIDAIRDSNGMLVGFAKIVRDITDRINQQESLEQAREELFQTQKLEAIGQLTGGVAHDFNNLLMVVMGSLEVLKRRLPADDRNSRLIDNAYQAAQRGAQLTKRMLAFARKQDLENRPVDLAEVVRGMGELLSRTLGHSVMVETRFPISLPKVSTDPNHLDAALLNLAVNARDAMPNGGTLRFSAAEHDIAPGHVKLKPGKYVCLSVEDTGEGMDEETLAHAREPFFTTKGVGKGTGLGLPMVQGIAEQSGGMMSIYSVKGEGTRVELWLEALAAETEPVAEVIKPDALTPRIAKTQLKVLAVDDDALVLLNTSLMLEELGHKVVEAHSGAEALALLEANQDIDLVITDHAMPRMTGVALAEEIIKQYPELPVALASGYADIEQARRMNLPRLAKPFTQGELQKLISTLTEAPAA
ncbi:PAS domain S-box protein [Devosia sp. WQ 349]|uniref:hybrid sensor histidine kinase/response regulator n=1 Tax=Devosia sp. WQ 349K1 TaxID=2800329 RepID=UPI0019069E38|nr:PAS domain-containing sensor histidine kinase [Devosia sp. WQ 349K1]MBK1794903.1 PAS domain S-box protein [Devosia sp. WQ 349K1]